MNTATIEACARAAHEANRAYCKAIGDDTQPAWEDAPEWQRASARAGVMPALDGATPEESHLGWMRLKEQEGWKWGPQKDPERKLHPCMVAYDQLPITQRAKDELYLSVVRAVAAALGFCGVVPVPLLLGTNEAADEACRCGAKPAPGHALGDDEEWSCASCGQHYCGACHMWLRKGVMHERTNSIEKCAVFGVRHGPIGPNDG